MYRIVGALVAVLVVASTAIAEDWDDYFAPVSTGRYCGERTYIGGCSLSQCSYDDDDEFDRYEGERTFIGGFSRSRCCRKDKDDYERYVGERTFFGGVPWSHVEDEDDCGDVCDSCCCSCPAFGPWADSDWYAGVDVVVLKRNQPDRRTLSILDTTGDTVLTTDDMNFEFESGFRVNVGRRMNERAALEVSFLNLGSWNSNTREFTPDPNDPSLDPYWGSSGAQPTDAFDDSYAHHYSYDSKLRDVEVNTRYFMTENTSVIFGFRYINVNENFIFLSQDAQDYSSWGIYNVGTSNDLYGLNLGISRQWCCGDHYSVGTYCKGGIFYNDIDRDSHIVNSGAIFRDERVDSSDSAFSTLVDVGVFGNYCIRDGVRLRAGYMFVYLNNIALGPEQFDPAPNQFALSGRVTDDGSMIYHGPTAGLDICW